MGYEISIWSSWISIWDILTLCPPVAEEHAHFQRLAVDVVRRQLVQRDDDVRSQLLLRDHRGLRRQRHTVEVQVEIETKTSKQFITF